MKKLHSSRRASTRGTHRRRGQAQLIGLLVVVVIGMIIYYMFLGPRTSPDGESRKSIAASSIDMAKEVELNSNISQIQMGIGMYKGDNEGRFPASMDDLKRALKDYPAEMFINPIDKKPLLYNPTTGQVSPQPYPGMKPAGSARAPGAAVESAADSGGAPQIKMPNIPQSSAPASGELDANQ